RAEGADQRAGEGQGSQAPDQRQGIGMNAAQRSLSPRTAAIASGKARFDRRRAELFMRAALAEATKGVGRTSPNPAVGAVLVKAGQIIAGGSHRRAGAPHAEAVAIRRAGPRARGAELYTTLEPCNHYGRTPPCTSAILDAGVARVICALRDPDPQVKGRGMARLRRAGLPPLARGPPAPAPPPDPPDLH